MKRKSVSAILIAVLVASLFVLSGCVSQTAGKSAYDIAVEYGFEGTPEEWLASLKGKDGTSSSGTNNGDVVINNEDTSNVQYAANKGLLSSVSVYAHFVKTVTYGGNPFGFGSSGREYSYDSYAAGSGVIYQLDATTGSAFIITNYHVVYDSSSDEKNHISKDIQIFLYGKEDTAYAIPATYVGGSMTYDIAVLYVENNDLLKTASVKPITIADSDDLSTGEYAIAIGNPEALGISVTCGIVSVPSEYISMTAVDGVTTVSWRVVRIDTAVNSGNSGGGLFNIQGDLIGIVNSKVNSTEVENIGYAIPSNVAIAIADNIIYYCFGNENESVQRAMLGVTIQTEESNAVFDSETGLFTIVEKVSINEVSNSGLADGKLKAGDIIKSVTVGDETKLVTRRHHIIDMLLKARAGDTVYVKVERDGTEIDVEFEITLKCLEEY